MSVATLPVTPGSPPTTASALQTCSGMSNTNVGQFKYAVRPTIPSLLWATWLYIVPRSLRLKTYKFLESYRPYSELPGVIELPFGILAKRGGLTTVDEALANHYVSLHTTIPVPTILDVLPNSGGGAYFLMTRIPGREIAEMPRDMDEYSDQEMDVFVATLTGWLEQLRALGPSPYGDSVCGFTGGSFQSFRINHNGPVGPFASQDEFHGQYYNTLPDEADAKLRALGARLRSQKRYKMYLTHGDLSPNNILVDDNYKPVGLIDWGCASWMPEYWELTYALYRRQRYAGWVTALTRSLPQYKDELEVEMEQWKYVYPW